MSQHLPISGFSARSMCPIHVLAFMSQHLCISGSSARSMSPDPCLNIHIYLRNLCKIHVSGCLNIHIYLRSFCKIHVSDACRIASLSSDFVALRRRNANFDRLRRVLRGPAQGKQSGRDPRERFAQAKRKFWAPETRFVWPCAGKTVRPSVSRRPRCIFCGPAQAKRKFWPPETHLLSRWSGFTRSHNRMNKIATALQQDAKKNSQPEFGAGETQILTSGVAFSVALRSKKRGGQKFAPGPKRLYPYRKNPSVWHTVWGNICFSSAAFCIYVWILKVAGDTLGDEFKAPGKQEDRDNGSK